MGKEIKAIFFDSGRVLNGPKSGNWLISPKFFEYVNKELFDSIAQDKKDEAFSKAYEYISSIKEIKTMDEEYRHFIKYYEIFAEELPKLDLSKDDIEGLAKDLVYNPEKYEFYQDAIKEIPELSSKYRLAVVSDAWPSLKSVFEKAGMDKFFDAFEISSELGVTKPDEKMYLKALNDLNVLPKNTIFVDDNIDNCKGAMELGIYSVLLCRDKLSYVANKVKSINKKYSVINSLTELDKLPRFNEK